jgi:hypothetical protein
VHDEDERQILVHLVNDIIATNLVRGLEFFCMSLMTGVIRDVKQTSTGKHWVWSSVDETI